MYYVQFHIKSLTQFLASCLSIVLPMAIPTLKCFSYNYLHGMVFPGLYLIEGQESVRKWGGGGGVIN